MPRLRLPLCGVALVLAIAGCESFSLPDPPSIPGLPPPPGPTPASCGAATPWDRDGDTISDNIERNNRAEGYHALDPGRCDADPSSARGSYADGRLRGGLNLTDRGTGYRHHYGPDAVDSDDWATLEMINCLEAVSRRQQGVGRPLTVLDLSLRRGGPFPPHRTHQNGLDADLRYLRKDRRLAPLDLRLAPKEYARGATRQLFRALVRECAVAVILVDLDRIGFGNEVLDRPVLVHAPGHSNHFHLRLETPRD